MSPISTKLFKLEFFRSIKGTLIWSVSIGLSLFLIVLLYPMAMELMDALNQMLDYLGSVESQFLELLDGFGGIPENGVEYFATEGAMFLQLLGGIYAAIIGFGIINKDEKEKTLEVLHVLPISRSKILFTKMMNVAFSLLLFTFIQILFIEIGFLIVAHDEDISILWLFGLYDYIMFLMISFLSMGLALFLKPNQSSFIAIAIPFPLYIITLISNQTNNEILKFLKYFSPFTFTEPVNFLKNQSDFELINFLVFVSLTIVVIILSFIKFRKREMI
jgi:ABC-2 type transport system permease protein